MVLQSGENAQEIESRVRNPFFPSPRNSPAPSLEPENSNVVEQPEEETDQRPGDDIFYQTPLEEFEEIYERERPIAETNLFQRRDSRIDSFQRRGSRTDSLQRRGSRTDSIASSFRHVAKSPSIHFSPSRNRPYSHKKEDFTIAKERIIEVLGKRCLKKFLDKTSQDSNKEYERFTRELSSEQLEEATKIIRLAEAYGEISENKKFSNSRFVSDNILKILLNILTELNLIHEDNEAFKYLNFLKSFSERESRENDFLIYEKLRQISPEELERDFREKVREIAFPNAKEILVGIIMRIAFDVLNAHLKKLGLLFSNFNGE